LNNEVINYDFDTKSLEKSPSGAEIFVSKKGKKKISHKVKKDNNTKKLETDNNISYKKKNVEEDIEEECLIQKSPNDKDENGNFDVNENKDNFKRPEKINEIPKAKISFDTPNYNTAFLTDEEIE
jgi:hypothetical protein